MPHIQREFLGNQSDTIPLSYYTDTRVGNALVSLATTTRVQTHFDNTLNVGGSYIHAAFVGQKQVYPPICLVTLSNLRGEAQNDEIIEKTIVMYSTRPYSHVSITDKTYLMPKSFIARYAVNMGTSYSSVVVPSFNPVTSSNNSQFAYFSGNRIIIKDPALPNYKVPFIDEYSSMTSYFTYFSMEPNTSVCNTNKTTWDTLNYPLSYVRFNNLDIYRRTFEMGQNIRLRTTKTTQTSNTAYYYFRYFYKGTELTNSSDIAKLIPQQKFMSLEGSYTMFGAENIAVNSIGFNPNCFFNGDQISKATGRYKCTIIGMNNYIQRPIIPYMWQHSAWNENGNLFNLHFIKVNGNENMYIWGQSSSYYNYKSVSWTETFNTDTVNFTASTVLTNTGGINSFFVSPTIASETHTDIPKKNSIVFAIDNTISSSFGAASLRHRFANNTNLGNQTSYSFATYAGSQVFSDISSISVTANDTSATVSIAMNSRTGNGARTTKTADASCVGTYTYCYIAADIIARHYHDPKLVANRVVSDSYVCILGCAGQTSGSTTVTYNVEYF